MVVRLFKVFFVTETFLPAKLGGTEMYLYNLCKQLQNKNVYCKVFCQGNTDDYYQYEYENIKVEICPSSDEGSIFNRLLTAKISEGFDVLHIHSFNGQINNSFLSELNKLEVPLFFTPHLVNNFCNNNGSLRFKSKSECNGIVSIVKCQTCIFSNHDTLPFFYKNYLFHFFLHRLLPDNLAQRLLSKYHFLAHEKLERIQLLNKQQVKVIALSEWYEALLRKNRLNNITLVQQGVGSSFLSNAKPAKPLRTDQAVRWIFIGRMCEDKGVKELIEVFSKIGNPCDELTIVSAKPDSNEPYFLEVIQTINNIKQISVVYDQPADEVVKLLSGADCLVLPSKITEMAPLVVQEAAALRKPVLVSEFIRIDVERKRIGLRFSFAMKGDFAVKMNQMRVKVINGSFTSIDRSALLTFEQVAEKHISLYLTYLPLKKSISTF